MAGGTSPRLGLKKQSRKRSIPRHVQHEFIPAKRFVARTLVLGSALPQALFGAPDAPVLGVLLCSVPIGIALIVSGARNLRPPRLADDDLQPIHRCRQVGAVQLAIRTGPLLCLRVQQLAHRPALYFYDREGNPIAAESARSDRALTGFLPSS